MKAHPLYSPFCLSTVFILLSTFSELIQSRDNSSDYDRCAPFGCGNITFTFPFSSSNTFGSDARDCGLPRYEIACDQSSAGIEIAGRLYQVKSIFSSDNLITVVDRQLIDELNAGSCDSLRSLSFPHTNIAPITLPVGGTNLTFFKCNSGSEITGEIHVNELRGEFFLRVNCSMEDDFNIFIANDTQSPSIVDPPRGCSLVSVPVLNATLFSVVLNASSSDDRRKALSEVLSDGFPLHWPNITTCEVCESKNGRCGYDGNSRGQVVCFYKGGGNPPKKMWKWLLPVGVASGSTVLVIAVIVLLTTKYRKRSSKFFRKIYFEKNYQPSEDGRNAQEFIKNYRSTLLTNYSYNDIKRMTNNFKDKLGEGGYGRVFKGKLFDGRVIAVKMLDKSKDIVSRDFINEVATIGTIHHVNIIRLLGFCCDGSKEALIYEYMPNGSLGDFISNDKVSGSLGMAKLLEIAIGIAHGIEYLQNGCDSRILHLDIKPQNVLLDQNFNPKISDFGLAKVYSRNRNTITMTGGPRGTIGYIAPEVFLRNLGKPSYKSDVYSYGMLLLDMAGGRKHNIEMKSSASGEMYFPSWIHKKLVKEKENSKLIGGSVEEEEVIVARKMVMVGLWCIQINPNDRPSMTKVLEMLCGDAEDIELPPEPLLFSPPRVQFEHEITTTFESDSCVLPTSGS